MGKTGSVIHDCSDETISNRVNHLRVDAPLTWRRILLGERLRKLDQMPCMACRLAKWGAAHQRRCWEAFKSQMDYIPSCWFLWKTVAVLSGSTSTCLPFRWKCMRARCTARRHGIAIIGPVPHRQLSFVANQHPTLLDWHLRWLSRSGSRFNQL